MRRIWLPLVLASLFLPRSALAGRKRTVDPRVRDVRTVFIKGNNEAAVKARASLSTWTCFRLAANPGQADATLDFSQQQSVSGAMFSANRERSIVSAELTSKNGDVLWSQSASQDAGIINTGAGSATHSVLSYLQADAFPGVKAGLRGPSESACSEVNPPAAASVVPGAAPPLAESNAMLTTETNEIKLGMTAYQVEQILGSPVTRADLGEKVLFRYRDMTVEFHDGRVTDVR